MWPVAKVKLELRWGFITKKLAPVAGVHGLLAMAFASCPWQLLMLAQVASMATFCAVLRKKIQTDLGGKQKSFELG